MKFYKHSWKWKIYYLNNNYINILQLQQIILNWSTRSHGKNIHVTECVTFWIPREYQFCAQRWDWSLGHDTFIMATQIQKILWRQDAHSFAVIDRLGNIVSVAPHWYQITRGDCGSFTGVSVRTHPIKHPIWQNTKSTSWRSNQNHRFCKRPGHIGRGRRPETTRAESGTRSALCNKGWMENHKLQLAPEKTENGNLKKPSKEDRNTAQTTKQLKYLPGHSDRWCRRFGKHRVSIINIII